MVTTVLHVRHDDNKNLWILKLTLNLNTLKPDAEDH